MKSYKKSPLKDRPLRSARQSLEEQQSRLIEEFFLFPGWFVKSAGRPSRPLWVLNPKALPEYLKHRDTVLSESDIHLAGYHLSRFIRAGEQRRVGYSS